MRWKRWLGIGVVAVVVVLAIAYGYRPQPILVEAAAADRGPLQVTIEEEGKTRVTDRFVVSAPVTGYARRVRLDVGDPVTQGRVLLSLEPPRSVALDPRTRAEAEARVAVAEAALRQAREKIQAIDVDAAYWEGEMARVERLYASKDVSKQRYDQTVTEVKRIGAEQNAAERAVDVAEAQVKAAQAVLRNSAASPGSNSPETVEVRAPVSGRVLKIVRESEGVVSAGEPLIEIGNARSLEVVIEVLSADAVRIHEGTRVVFERWGGSEPLEGRVRSIEPVAFTKISALGVEEQRVLVIADITSPPEVWRRLGDGYRVEARFILWESDSVLRVPASALFRHQDGWALFVVENGAAARRQVQVGQRNGLTAEITSGIEEGAPVLAHPDDSISEGTLVAVRGEQ